MPKTERKEVIYGILTGVDVRVFLECRGKLKKEVKNVF